MKSPTFTEEQVLALAHDAYLGGKASFAIETARCALLVIDMQDEFVRPHWTAYWVPEATRQVGRVKQLILACRSLAIPVIYTVFSASHHRLDRPRSGATMPNRHAKLEPEGAGWFRAGRVWHELAPEPQDIVIHKSSYGAFHDTPLETILKNLARDTVIICGTLTNLCCDTTARQAYELGYHVVFGSDVTATNDEQVQEAELRTLRYGFARVMSSTEIVATLEAAARGRATPTSNA